jgi:hypothetical protein
MEWIAKLSNKFGEPWMEGRMDGECKNERRNLVRKHTNGGSETK